MRKYEKEKQLWALAEGDDIYLTWKKGKNMCEGAFREFAETCPEELRGILYGYAECGQMMCQRVVSLACKYMDFMEEEES